MNYMRCADHAARMDEIIEYILLTRDADCNRCLRRDNCDQRNNIKVDYKLTEWDRVEWIDVVQGRDDCRCCGCSNDSGPFSVSQSHKPV
jgi:hypothetical protein